MTYIDSPRRCWTRIATAPRLSRNSKKRREAGIAPNQRRPSLAARSATPSGDESPPFTLAPNSIDDIAGRERFLSRLVGTRGAPNATAIRRSFSDETPWTEEREAPGIGTNGRMQFLDGAGSIDFPTRDPDAHQFSRPSTPPSLASRTKGSPREQAPSSLRSSGLGLPTTQAR